MLWGQVLETSCAVSTDALAESCTRNGRDRIKLAFLEDVSRSGSALCVKAPTHILILKALLGGLYFNPTTEIKTVCNFLLKTGQEESVLLL